METLIKNENQITEELLSYIFDEVKELAEKSNELEIQNYIDRELLNPQMKEFIEKSDDNTPFFDETDATAEPLVLTNSQYFLVSKKSSLKSKFRRLKRKIRRIFCEVTQGLEDIDTKEIIRKVLLALIPGFAVGIPAVVFPIIIGIIAYFLKKGYEATCLV